MYRHGERTDSPQEEAGTEGASPQPESWCGPGQTTAVNFTRENGKTVSICREGETLTYAYGSLESSEPELVYSGPEVASLGGAARMWGDVEGGLCGRGDDGELGELARARDTNGFVVFSGWTGLFSETAYVFRRDGWEYEVVDTWGRGQTSDTPEDYHESTITVRSPSDQGCLQGAPGFCDRAPEIRDAIMAEVGTAECGLVSVGDLAEVSALDLSGRDLTSLPQGAFADLPNLRFLDLGDNRLTSLPEGTFAALPNLRFLDLGDNRLTSLPEGVLSLDDLSQLELYGNPLRDPIPPEVGRLANLAWLDQETSRTVNQLGSDRGFNFNDCGICPRDYDPDWRSDFSNGFLEETETCSYSPVRLVDGNPQTGWVEGTQGVGIGAEVVVPALFDPVSYYDSQPGREGRWVETEPLDLSKPVRIWAGYGRSPKLFAANGRPKRLRVTVLRLRRGEIDGHDATGCSHSHYEKPVVVAAHEVELLDHNGYQELPLPEYRVEHYLQYPMEWLSMDGSERAIHQRQVDAGQAQPFQRELTEYVYVLKLTLLDIYPGTHYEDTVISEVGNEPARDSSR